MRVDRPYKGVTESALIVVDDLVCRGPNFRPGQQYLLYTERTPSGEVASGACARAIPIRYAGNDIAYLNSRRNLPPKGWVFGTVWDRSDSFIKDKKTAPATVVQLANSNGILTAATGVQGEYAFHNVEPGTYALTVSRPGYRMVDAEQASALRVNAKGCVAIDVAVRKKWKAWIIGRVLRADGRVAGSGIVVDVLRRDPTGTEHAWIPQGYGQRTNEQSEFVFEELAPGEYKIVLNRLRFPTATAPFPPLYWPGVSTETEAQMIHVPDGASQQRFDFHLPPPPAGRTVHGIVLSPNGKPVEGAEIRIEAEPWLSGADNGENFLHSDAQGRFSFVAFEGFKYLLWAHKVDKQLFVAEKVPFSLGRADRVLALRLGASK